MEDAPLVLPSALKHGLTEPDVLHAYRQSDYVMTDATGRAPVDILVGPSQSGAVMIELGVIDWYGLDAIAHAMPARKRFLEGGKR